jgi:hypothetical protein
MKGGCAIVETRKALEEVLGAVRLAARLSPSKMAVAAQFHPTESPSQPDT